MKNREIDIQNLSVGFDNDSSELLFDKLGLEVEQNTKVAISGESGAGKTTLLKVIIGRHLPKSGFVKISDLSLCRQNLTKIRERLFYLPQFIKPLEDETVRQYLEQPFLLKINRHLRFNTQDALNVLSQVKLPENILNRPLSLLSGGEQKRVGLARGIMLKRPVWLLDEPTTGIDKKNRNWLVELLLSLQNTTILSITHDDSLMHASDKHYELKDKTLNLILTNKREAK